MIVLRVPAVTLDMQQKMLDSRMWPQNSATDASVGMIDL